MSEVTAEQAYAAADIVESLWRARGAVMADKCAFNAEQLRAVAENLDREQAEKAKRDKRIEELAQFVCDSQPDGAFSSDWNHTQFRRDWIFLTSALLDRYPSLLDEDGER